MWVLGAEIQTMDTRTSGMSATVAVNYLCSFIIGGPGWSGWLVGSSAYVSSACPNFAAACHELLSGALACMLACR